MSTSGAAESGTTTTSHWWTGRELLLRGTRIWHAFDPCENRWRSLSTADRPLFAETYAADFDGERLVILTVFDNTGADNAVEFGSYDVARDVWSEPSQEGMHTSADRALVLTGEEAILWGGRDPVQGSTGVTWTGNNTGSVFDFTSGTWRAMSTESAPPARTVTPTMYDFEDGRMVVWGGRISKHVLSNEASQQEYDACDPMTGVCPLLSSGGIYDVAGDSWQPIDEQGAPPPRNHPIVEWYQGKVLVLLGQSYPDSNSWRTFQDGGLYDPGTSAWTLFDGPAELARPAVTGWPHVWLESGLWISDGDSGDWVFDPETLTFRAAPEAPEGARCSPFGATYPVCRNADGQSFLGSFDAAAWAWTLTELPAYLLEWNSPLEFWTGSTLVRWGGQKPDPNWVAPTCDPSFPTCDVGGPPMLPNATGGLFTP